MVLQRDSSAGRLLLDMVGAACSAPGSHKVAYLLPSTRVNFSAVAAVVRNHPGVPFVGTLVDGARQPLQVLAALRRGEACPVLIIFSDQLFGPEIANIPCKHDGGSTFYSGFESILFAKYGYTLNLPMGASEVSLPPPGSVDDALALLRRYFEHAASLGPDWLLAERQVERTLPGRIREARMRSGFLRSAVYHRYAERPLDTAGRATLGCVDDVEQRMLEAGR
ncbi:hypothetical protein [Stenotrophomonas sp. ZAC14D2_NAIMI4_7]|uniref:hypothetical protein n=1 Tax=Stenotrophomonas sp. ZAC14D2_NAIMI4_7 TaxID=2072405 RepID=UPI00131F20C6|nr:hypothetical protein [Stenotrophomonas sp. ZAC14D2_NAIMI4_7]